MLNELLIKELSEQVGINTFDIQVIKDAEVYSTSEVKTNKIWINGKPIYRKVVAVSAPTYSSGTYALSEIPHNISKVDNIWIAGGYWLESSEYRYEISAGSITSGAKIRPSVNKTQIQIYNSWSNANGWTGYMILEYTKTTD